MYVVVNIQKVVFKGEKTVQWYLQNQKWMDDITSGEYQEYYQSMYKDR